MPVLPIIVPVNAHLSIYQMVQEEANRNWAMKAVPSARMLGDQLCRGQRPIVRAEQRGKGLEKLLCNRVIALVAIDLRQGRGNSPQCRNFSAKTSADPQANWSN
jgi:hypothetical protein